MTPTQISALADAMVESIRAAEQVAIAIAVHDPDLVIDIGSSHLGPRYVVLRRAPLGATWRGRDDKTGRWWYWSAPTATPGVELHGTTTRAADAQAEGCPAHLLAPASQGEVSPPAVEAGGAGGVE